MKRERDNHRLEKAIDELIKIQDDGNGTEEIAEILDRLNCLIHKDRT